MQSKNPETLTVDVEKLTPEEAVGIATSIARKFGPIFITGSPSQQSPIGGNYLIPNLYDPAVHVGLPVRYLIVSHKTDTYELPPTDGVILGPKFYEQAAIPTYDPPQGVFIQGVTEAIPSPIVEENEDEGSEADWQAVKEEVLRLLKAEALDTPASHLAYVREKLKSVLDHVGS